MKPAGRDHQLLAQCRCDLGIQAGCSSAAVPVPEMQCFVSNSHLQRRLHAMGGQGEVHKLGLDSFEGNEEAARQSLELQYTHALTYTPIPKSHSPFSMQ